MPLVSGLDGNIVTRHEIRQRKSIYKDSIM